MKKLIVLNRPDFKYKPQKVRIGDLRIPVSFFEYGMVSSPEPSQEKKLLLYECFAEIYSPSMKDLEKLKHSETKQAITINIRDSRGEYIPTNKHFVEINDYRYKDVVWNVIDVVHDMTNNAFIKIILGVIS